MSEQDPIDPELADFITLERTARDGIPDANRQRIKQRLALAAGLGVAAIGVSAEGSVLPKLATIGAKLKVLPLAAAFAIGGATGAALTLKIVSRSKPSQEIETPRQATTEVPPPPATAPVSPPPAGQVSTAPSKKPIRAAHQVNDDTLAIEQTFIDTARAALLRQREDDALAALAQHEHRFPQGQLREERDLLMVRALLAAERGAEAAKHAQKFRTDYPGSLLLPMLDKVVGRMTPTTRHTH